jgi:hypothetical protein
VTDDGAAAAAAHIASLDEPRRSQLTHLHEVITAAMPGAPIRMFEYGGPLIGYGIYAYTNSKGPAGDWFAVGLASRKAYVSLFSMGQRDGGYLVEAVHDRFPGTTIGRSCLNIKDPTTISDDAVRDLVTETWAQYRHGQPARPTSSGRPAR